MNENKLLERITVDPHIFGGKPIIRGRRLAVEHVLGMLAAGDSPDTILSGYPWLEPEDIQACFLYAEKNESMALKDPTENLNVYLRLLPAVRHSPKGRLQASYDEEGDVLCVHFGRQPRLVTDGELADDVIIRYDGEEVIGITILHASQRG